jgi:hypothetical protein
MTVNCGVSCGRQPCIRTRPLEATSAGPSSARTLLCDHGDDANILFGKLVGGEVEPRREFI